MIGRLPTVGDGEQRQKYQTLTALIKQSSESIVGSLRFTLL